MFTCISERVKFCILLLMVNLFFCTCISYDSVEILGSQLFRCIHIRHSSQQQTLHDILWERQKNHLFYHSTQSTSVRTVQEIIPIKLNFYTLYELKIKKDSDNEKNCESNAVHRVITPYTIKRRPPNTVSCLTRQIYFTRGNIVYGRSVELCNLS